MAKIKVTCKYFTTVLGATKKDEETIEIAGKMSVEKFIEFMSDKYGSEFSKNVYAEGTIQGKKFKTPNIYLNKKRIQWIQDFPDGVKTIVKDGDEFWFGLIVGGGNSWFLKKVYYD
jgi:molybdopterin converting factor small subunit